jgi:uncharacterized protein YegJ (DUF2314 family)
VLLTALSGCDDRDAGGASSPPAQVMTVEEADPEMTAAMAKARETLPEFLAALRAPTPAQSAFTIKAPFRDGERIEYMSVTPVTFDGKTFHGTLHDQPVSLHNIKLGAKVTVEPGRVADWSYVEEGKLAGGYTLRVLRGRMSTEQRREFDRTRAFTLD